ncbi:MAG TPA: TIGR03620 family F420-dependent LLM class oxidoreductase [Acidimicrobiales bacterium]|jgi:probable F420-dependent oxidoreductase|nr:TIGR03620 family F420-dependent LLM class oxidoreductase [Acidimicrobiales bacterium]
MSTWPSTLEKLRGSIGLWTAALDSVSPSESASCVHEIESLGYRALWVPEAWGRESFTNASLLLSSTSSLIVATGIANIWARDAVTAANGSKTLSAAYGDRFVLGLGVSHEPLVTRLRGHHYETPYRVMKEFLLAMDGAPMMADEGRTRVPRVIAALGPKMLELAAELTDGAHPYLVTPAHTELARSILGDKFLGVEQAVVLGQNREEFLRRAHQHLEHYSGLENYRNSWRRQGFGDDDIVRGGSDRLCDALVLHGDEDAILEGVQEHFDAGASHVCLQVLGADPSEVPREEWRRLAFVITTAA